MLWDTALSRCKRARCLPVLTAFGSGEAISSKGSKSSSASKSSSLAYKEIKVKFWDKRLSRASYLTLHRRNYCQGLKQKETMSMAYDMDEADISSDILKRFVMTIVLSWIILKHLCMSGWAQICGSWSVKSSWCLCRGVSVCSRLYIDHVIASHWPILQDTK